MRGGVGKGRMGGRDGEREGAVIERRSINIGKFHNSGNIRLINDRYSDGELPN